MARIIVDAADVWWYFQKHKNEMKGISKMIADSQEYGVEIFITSNGDLPVIAVLVDDEEIYSEETVSEKDCYHTVKEIYEDYLSRNVMDILTEDESYTAAEEMEMIDEREVELNNVVFDFLTEVAPNISEIADDIDELCDSLTNAVCEWLYTEYGISVYRPMYLENEDGKDEFVKFPYPEMDIT